MDNINILMAQFERNLNQLLTDSQLPVGVAYYILKNTTDKLHNNYVGFINSYYIDQAEINKENANTTINPDAETITIENNDNE